MARQAHKEEFSPLLPEGFHLLSPKEVSRLCVDQFPDSTVRAEIMTGLHVILERLAVLEFKCEIWLNGSFTTQKLEPDDVDFIIFASIEILEGDNPERDDFIEWLNDKNDEPKKLFKCHTEVVIEGGEQQFASDLLADTRKHWQNQFGYSVTSREPKGIVVLNLKEPLEDSAIETDEGGDQ